MRVALYPGSFDPITNGHLDIIERASGLFDRLIVTVAKNLNKVPLFSIEERVSMLEELLCDLPNVEVDAFAGLTVNYARKQGAKVIVRGLRATMDFENEFVLALTNKKLAPEVETLYLMSRAEYSFISSSMAKEVASLHGCLKELVPEIVAQRLRQKFSKQKDIR